jgi:hypothetical protein
VSLTNRKTLPELCAAVIEALRSQDEEAFSSALSSVGVKARRSDVEELSAAALVLAPAVAGVPLGYGSQLAVLAGGLIELGADPDTVLEPLTERICDGLERAARFPALWQQVTGGTELPNPSDESLIPAVLARLAATAHQHGLDPRTASGVAEGWFAADDWVPGLLVPLQHQHIRQALPHRERLLVAAQTAGEFFGATSWLPGLLLVLDGEPVIVLHRPSGLGYRLTIGGIGDNFQLHTLLAATLIGDETRGMLPGVPPAPDWVTAATEGAPQVDGGIAGQFNLVDGYGEWIWGEGRPADIPLLDGARVVVLDPPSYPRTWNVGRTYPLMRPTIRLDRRLSPAEVAGWLDRIPREQPS